MSPLNTTDPNHFVYENALLRVEVLGGIKVEGLDRMRATLKAALPDSPRPPIRHNLDLYNDNQTEKFIRKTAERLEIGTSVIAAVLSELTEGLEKYRLEQLQELRPREKAPRLLSEEECTSAKAYLQKAGLMERTGEDLAQSGIIGEWGNALILYLAMSSRKCPDPLSVICLAQSGTGKSYLMESVAACFPEDDLLENTQFTENSFYYFRREEIRGKVFLIEDLDGAQAVLYPIRELQSKKRISKTVTVKDKTGQLRTVSLIVEGPVSVVGCTTKETIYEDNANRSILIYLDGSKEQDQNILDYQKKLKAGLIDKHSERAVREALQNTQCLLEPVKVINPYALLIDLPKEVFKPRRTMGLLLSFIEAITYYHQWQRDKQYDPDTGEEYIETTPEDIAWAFKLLRETLFRKSDELSGACRSFLETLQELVKPFEDGKFYASTIRQHIRIHPRTLQRYLKELTEYNYLHITGGNKHKSGYQYELNPGAGQQDLQHTIDKQIAHIMDQVEKACATRSTPVRKRTTKPRVSHSTTLKTKEKAVGRQATKKASGK